MIGAFFRNARAIEIRWRSPPDSSQPFSPILVCHPSGSFLANSSTLASFAAAMTCSSVASLFPIRIFSRIVLSNSVTSWNTMEYRESSVSRVYSGYIHTSHGNLSSVNIPEPCSQPGYGCFPAARWADQSVTSPCFAVKETSFNTVSPVL